MVSVTGLENSPTPTLVAAWIWEIMEECGVCACVYVCMHSYMCVLPITLPP